MKFKIDLEQMKELSLTRFKTSTKEKRTWNILEKVGEGGSSVCYKAESDGVKGHLKCIRNSKYFVNVYDKLMEIKNDSSENEILYNYIPYIELYKDAENDDQIYSWAPEDFVGETLSDYFKQVHSKKEDKEDSLFTIIGLIISIVRATAVLHKAGFLHLDIKPSNYLVPYYSTKVINEYLVSMFDIDSFRYMTELDMGDISSTDGFAAPEIDTDPDTRSDIFSIGATLFYAITNERYSEEKYDRLDDLVRESIFIKGTEFEQDDYLIYQLIQILRKSLCYQTRRYTCCEALLKDLEEARTEMIPVVKRQHINLDRRISIEESDKNKNPTAIMQNVLYKDPLYLYADDNKDINVLVIGSGAYARRFMDLCLQSSQMSGYKINITNLCVKSDLVCNIYKELRPGMTEFVRINDEYKRSNQVPYGNIVFDELVVDFSKYKYNNETSINKLINQVSHLWIKDKLSYVFVSVGDDRFNRNISNKLKSGLSDIYEYINRVPFYYAIQDRIDGEDNNIDDNAYTKPIYLYEDYEKIIDRDLERWAFNTHLIWMSDKNPDYYEAKNLFEDKYNYDASIAFALSIKYKLYSMGIDMESILDERQLADIAVNNLDFVHAEHRRWVIQKLCDGWKSFEKNGEQTDYNVCIKNGSVKINDDKLHPCLVYDSATENLRFYTDEMWDNPGEYDNDLDELDKMSVDIYREFRDKALGLKDQYKNKVYRKINYMRKVLKEHIYSADNLNMCGLFCDCIDDIMTSFDDKEKQKELCAKFDSMYEYLVKIADDNYAEALRKLKVDVFAIEQYIYRVDYKMHDKRLIEKIPFIIKNEPKPYEPSPIDVEGIMLSDEMVALVDKLAANDHDVWAKKRMSDGWVYGSVRDDVRKTNPCIMPFDRLPENEKEYDRAVARQYICILIKLGYLYI